MLSVAPERSPTSPAGRLGAATVLLAALVGLASFHPYPYDNVVTRWALVRQIVENSTLRIDPYADLTSDLAWSGGHYYCDKAVLLQLAGVALYRPEHAVARMLGLADAAGTQSACRYVTERVLVLGLFLLLLRSLRGALEPEGARFGIGIAALGLGSILLPYSTLFYAHVPAAFFLTVSWISQKNGRMAQADIAGAVACALEFPVLIPFAVLVAYRPHGWTRPWPLCRLALLLAAALAPQAAHNWMAFGSPLRMGYELETADAFAGMHNGFFGFAAPSLRALYLITFSPERGLFFYMPWAAAGLVGLIAEDERWASGFRGPLLPAVLLYILAFSCYYMPSGGWAFGPRHLIPIIPFLAVGLARFASRSAKHLFTAGILLIPGVLQAVLGTFGEVHQPVHPPEAPVPLPQVRIGLAMLLEGHHSLWLFGSAAVAILCAGALLLAVLSFRSARFSWAGIAGVLFWLALSMPSALADWGGRIDFYRGVLAEHRQEYSLAARYYLEAARDPTAPPAVAERAEMMTRLASSPQETE